MLNELEGKIRDHISGRNKGRTLRLNVNGIAFLVDLTESGKIMVQPRDELRRYVTVATPRDAAAVMIGWERED